MSLATAMPGQMSRRAFLGFVAGFVTVLTFFQLAILLLYWFGVLSNPPFNMAPSAPFGVPQTISNAFFGGLWGILFAFLEPRFPRSLGYWVTALLFGAILLDLVAWFVVAPLKGRPIGNGFTPRGVSINVFLQSVWGLGMAIIYKLIGGSVGAGEPSPLR